MPSKELIEKMKQAKAATGVTCAELERRTEEMGAAVSQATIKRVFSSGSEGKSFRIGSTLLPIARALLTTEEIQAALTPGQDANEEKLRATTILQDEMIELLNNQLGNLQAERDALAEQLKAQKRVRLLLSIALGVVAAAAVVLAIL